MAAATMDGTSTDGTPMDGASMDGTPIDAALGHDELAAVTARLAVVPPVHLLPATDGRRWACAEVGERHDAWVIAWPSGTGIRMHDHDGSIASVRVVSGRLRERYVDERDQVLVRWLLPGDVFELPHDHRHEVVNVDGTEAISVHAYSPPMAVASSAADEIVGAPLARRARGVEPREARRDRSRDVDVAIVGAGASGLLTVAHLARSAARAGRRLSIALVDPSARESVGVAYSTSCDEHVMNVRSCALSAFGDEPRHFVEWLSRRDGTIDPHGFVPRRLFGAYLRAVADDLPSGVTVHRIHERCVRTDAANETTRLHLEDGTELRARHLVLALGNANPTPVAGAASGMIDSPWHTGALDPIGRDDEVVIVGTGLTAVDAVLALDAAGHRGRITAVSRHGRWPAAHTANPAPAASLDLDAFAGAPTARTLVAIVRRALAELDPQQGDWRAVVDGVRPHAVRIWRSLDEVERTRFLRHARPLWEVHRHRMAPSVAARLSEMLSAGRVDVVAGRVRSVHADGDRTVVSIEAHGASTELQTSWVINCTGPAADIERRRDALVRHLLDSGSVTPGWHGMGLDVDELGRVRDAAGIASGVISAIGPMRTGADYEATAIPEIRIHAAALAARLLPRAVGSAISDVA